MSRPVRTRFAPSPTGFLHIGGARTALFNWLLARRHGGRFILRVEDTDQARNTPEARAAIFDGLRWLGLDWDEGPGAGGDSGPYFQSQRTAIYEKWFEKLRDAGRLYQSEGAWRFRFERRPVRFHDLICGEITIDYRDESNTPDMVVRRTDGSFVFHFVNVVDDLEMGVSHVIRGEDHLMNTPKHLQLIEAFGAEPPAYAHMPLTLNRDGSKMSKRDQGAAIHEYPARGFLPDAVVNFMALLGWSPKDGSEVLTRPELIARFALEAVNRSPAQFDWDKCIWLNQQHLLRLDPADFAAASRPFVEAAGLPVTPDFPAIAASVQEKVQLLTEVPDAIRFYLEPDFGIDPDALAKISRHAGLPRLLEALAANLARLDDWSRAREQIQSTARELGVKPGQLMFPLRVALSGRGAGPDLGRMLAILGPAETVRRIESLTRKLPRA